MNYLKNKRLAIVDIETTGTSSTFGKIIEVGILVVVNGEVVETFTTLVNSEVPVSPFIGEITGIDLSSLENAPTFSDIAPRLSELLKDAIFVAHNARFDYGFIKNEFKRIGINFQATCLCTVRLSRALFPRYKRHDLSSIVERLELTCTRRHRAYDDAQALLFFMEKIESLGKGEEMEKAVNVLIKNSSYPQFLDEGTVGSLPRGPGVYIFYDNLGTVLYVGKSKNIHGRVLSHFSGDHASTKEMRMCEQTKRVETIQTVGELGALLLESDLVKSLNPLYNRQLRKTTSLVVARKIKRGEYSSALLEKSSSLSPDQESDIYGMFRSITQGKEFLSKICKEYKLCPKILGLDHSKGACFAYQLEQCGGACKGIPDPDVYNSLFEKAFIKRKIQAWRHKGPILIEEHNGAQKHGFVLENWCLLAEYHMDAEELPVFKTPVFNYDVYKIFARYMRNPAHRHSIRLLPQDTTEKIEYYRNEYIPTVSYDA